MSLWGTIHIVIKTKPNSSLTSWEWGAGSVLRAFLESPSGHWALWCFSCLKASPIQWFVFPSSVCQASRLVLFKHPSIAIVRWSQVVLYGPSQSLQLSLSGQPSPTVCIFSQILETRMWAFEEAHYLVTRRWFLDFHSFLKHWGEKDNMGPISPRTWVAHIRKYF